MAAHINSLLLLTTAALPGKFYELRHCTLQCLGGKKQPICLYHSAFDQQVPIYSCKWVDSRALLVQEVLLDGRYMRDITRRCQHVVLSACSGPSFTWDCGP